MSNLQDLGDQVVPVPSAAPDVTQEENPHDLILTSLAIFEGGKNETTLPSGKLLVIRPAKMGQMPDIMRFFHQIVGSLETSQLATLIDLVSKKQKEAIAAGKDPANVSLADIASSEVVGEAFGNASIISLLMAATFEYLPGFAKLFTNLTEDEYKDLDFDEGVLVIMGIFVLNYSFFIHRLLPIVMGFIKSVASENKKTRQLASKAKSAR